MAEIIRQSLMAEVEPQMRAQAAIMDYLGSDQSEESLAQAVTAAVGGGGAR